MSETRNRILQRLRAVRREPPPLPVAPPTAPDDDREALIARFTAALRAVRGEVHRLRDGDWPGWLARELPARGIRRLMTGSGPLAERLHAAPPAGLDLRRYDLAVEECKDTLFHDIDAGLTGCHGAIAATGSLILWPNRTEPRLLSLVPPVHIAVLDPASLHPDLASAVRAQRWHQGLPANALLVTGPSKTADIEQTLTWGIHGPRELIVLIVG